MTGKNGRETGLDLLRIYACFSLLPFHLCVYGVRHEEAFLNYTDTFIKALFEYHVPLFLMITGALFLSREKTDLKRLFSHNILHLVFVYLFWSFIYAIFDVLLNLQNVTDIKGLARWITMSTRDSHYHLWYLPTIISIYILLPVFHAAFHNTAFHGILKYAVCIFAVFGVIIKTLLLIPVKFDTYSVLLKKVDVGTFAGYIGFVFTGYLLYRIKDRITNRQMLILSAVSVICIAVTEIVNLSRVPEEGINTFFLYFPIPCYIIECTLFLLFARIRPERFEKRSGLIKGVSECMLGVYCIHDIMISIVEKIFAFIPDSLYILRLVLIAVISFVLCTGVVFLMRKSRILRKIAV